MKKERITPALLKAVYSSYRNQRRIMNELNRKLSAASTKDEWISIYQERAATIRAAYAVNSETNALLSDAVFGHKMDYDYAELFFSEDKAFYTDSEGDVFFRCSLLEKLVDYYREHNDLMRLIPLLDRLGQNYISSVKMHYEDNYLKAVECFKEILKFSESYNLIPDLTIRKLFFQAYYYLCCILPITECKDVLQPGQSLDYLLEVFSFYNSDLVQKIDGKSEEIRGMIDMIKENWLWIEYRIDYADSETRQAFVQIANDVYSNVMKTENNILNIPVSTVIAYQHALIVDGKTSYIDAFNYMLDYYYKKKEKFASFHGKELNLDEFYFQTKLPIALIKWLDKIDILSEMCALNRKKLIDEQNSYFVNLSLKGIYSHLIYESCCEWCFFAVDYLNTLEEKENFIITMLINRQPQTFFDSYLNSELAVMITESLYTHTPVLLNSVESFLKINSMPNTKRDVIEYVRKCALFHDIGMNLISRIEGAQYRELTDTERTVLKLHPMLGAGITEHGLDIYRDVIIGHHKSFDQASGYPEKVDMTNSPVRVVCDILAVCDALNAGTDKTGRCYKEPKDFSIVLSELITESGTVYNTNVVNLFLNDMDLAIKVDRLISKDRENIYYDYYVKYFEKSSK